MSDDISNVIDLASTKPIGQLAWIGRLMKNSEGGTLPTISNALIIMANDPAVARLLSFNAFTSQPLITRAPPIPEDGAPQLPGPYPRAWNAEDVIFIQGYMQRIWSQKFTKATIEDAMVAESSIRRFHPICDWLDSLKWDGKPRIDKWLSSAFEAPKTAMNRAVGAKFLIAAVRRIKNPGTKFDHMMVLEGKQGIGKSSAVKALFSEAWFSDSIPEDLNSKDAAMALLGVWCLEFAEIEALIKADVETIKAFLSRSVDRYRPPYGKVYIDRPRQGVLIGTTNSDDYLRDTSGNRRIWPVKCFAANTAWVEENREQLWAEAVAREATGETIWLDDADIMAEAVSIQSDRMIQDVWHLKISEWTASRSEVTISDVLEYALSVPHERMNKSAEMRVASVMKALSWTKKTVRKGKHTYKAWLAPEGNTVSTANSWDFE
jgi:predicted P-loop ATPase